MDVLPSGVGKTCLKCGHTRAAADAGPSYACPRCGAVYAKLEAAQNAREQAQEVRKERADQQAWEEENATELVEGRKQDGNLSVMAHVVYVLFVVPIGLTALVGVILAHVMQGRAGGSFVQSHFRWQIKTFWGALGVLLVGYLVGTMLFKFFGVLLARNGAAAGLMGVMGIGGLFAVFMLLVVLWCVYRVAKGWYNLVQGDEVT
jgi:uncharacterized membrane protein/predicted RNA-binding Zn-ribbon protein involved in translation (DUF1610 family)